MINALHSTGWLPQLLPCPVARLAGAVSCSEVPNWVLRLLHPEEYEYARQVSGSAFREWVAGRHCLAAAANPYMPRVPVLVRESGAPAVPAGVAASISHKAAITVAVAARECDGIGVDLEYVEKNDGRLARKILTVEELGRLGECQRADQTAFVTAHFALKESVYKAACEEEQEGMEFQDIELGLTPLALGDEGVWRTVSASMGNSRFETQGFIFRDRSWLLAIARRSMSR